MSAAGTIVTVARRFAASAGTDVQHWSAAKRNARAKTIKRQTPA
jgi:hypothetical protein